MTERIKKLAELTLNGKMCVKATKAKFDESDIELSEIEKDTKHLCNYILNQEPKITKYSSFTGNLLFDNSVIGDLLKSGGHRSLKTALEKYYSISHKDELEAEWQSITADYKKILEGGIMGIINEINFYLDFYMYEPEKMELLLSLRKIAVAIVRWTEKCVKTVRRYARKIRDYDTRKRLKKLENALIHSPKCKPRTFYEAVLSIYVCFCLDSDGLDNLDRYLMLFYTNDIDNEAITRDEAKEYLQELFLMVQSSTHFDFTHFKSGLRVEANDGSNEVSELIAEALEELSAL